MFLQNLFRRKIPSQIANLSLSLRYFPELKGFFDANDCKNLWFITVRLRLYIFFPERETIVRGKMYIYKNWSVEEDDFHYERWLAVFLRGRRIKRSSLPYAKNDTLRIHFLLPSLIVSMPDQLMVWKNETSLQTDINGLHRIIKKIETAKLAARV